MIPEVLAADTDPVNVAPQPVGISQMLFPLLLMFAIFYFLLIRPNQKKMKKRNEFLKALNKGDSVITTGGILGRIAGLTDTYVTLDIGENMKIKVLRSHIGYSAAELEQEGKAKTKEEQKPT